MAQKKSFFGATNKMPRGQHADEGRNDCLTNQHFDDKWWGRGNWMFQARKMPDSNDGDVAVFPFMKRTIAGLGKALTAEEIRVSVKKASKQVTSAVCQKIRARVLRNMLIAKVDGRNFYDESMTKK